MKAIIGLIIFSVILLSCNNQLTHEEPKPTDSVSQKLQEPVNFVGEYYNPPQNELSQSGLRIKLIISEDSLENQFVLHFMTDASKGKDSCTLRTQAIKRNDTLFTYLSSGSENAQMYITRLPHSQQKRLDVFTTKFKDKNILNDFCVGHASIVGTYELGQSSTTDSTLTQLGFIKSFANKTASSVQLFSFAPIRKRLTDLLGEQQFEKLFKNWVVEQPFELINPDIYKVSACKTKRCNIYKTNILFDLKNDNITVIVSQKGESSINTEKPSLELPPAIIDEIKKNVD